MGDLFALVIMVGVLYLVYKKVKEEKEVKKGGTDGRDRFPSKEEKEIE